MSAKSLPVSLRNHAIEVQKLLAAQVSVPEIAAFLALTTEDVLAIRAHSTNKSALIRAELAAGPKTTRDIVEATGIPMRVASALLSILRKTGRVDVIGRAPRSSTDPSDLRTAPVYVLTESGRARMKKLGEAL